MSLFLLGYKKLLRVVILAVFINLYVTEARGDRTDVLFTLVSPEIVCIKVCDTYPIKRITKALETKYLTVITYEDPIYTHRSDIEYNPGGSTKIKSFVREAYIEVNYRISPQTGQPISMKELLESVIDKNTQNGNPGIFRLLSDGDQFHVIPSKVRAASGEMVDVVPILDYQISIPEEIRTLNATMELLCKEISNKAGMTVIFSDCPSNLIFKKIKFGAENESARTILKRIQSKAKIFVWEKVGVSWTLVYNTNENGYHLGIHTFSPIETELPK